VWVRLPLANDQSSTRLQHSTELAKRPAFVRDLTECGDQECGIERRVWIGKLMRVPLRWDDVAESAFGRPALRLVEHLRLEIEDVDLASWFEASGNSEGVVPRARSYLEHPLARRRGKKTNQLAPPQQRTGQIEEDALAVGASRRIAPLSPGPRRYRPGTQEQRPDDDPRSSVAHQPFLGALRPLREAFASLA
jgi:hypothetical protein